MGRILTITDGGSIVFQEANADGDFAAKVIVKNLTGNRTITIPDKDVVLGGLDVGQAYPVTEGGTGRTSVPKNNLLVGSNSPTTLDLVTAPSVNGHFLGFDGNTNSLTWAPINVAITGEINTGANYDPSKPGVYATKVGTQLRFRNMVAGNGIQINQTATDLTFYVDPVLDTLRLASPNGILGTSAGGTGTVAPVGAYKYLRSNSTGTGTEWSNVTMVENFSGEIDYPFNKTSILSLSWPFACTITKIHTRITSGTMTAQFVVNSTNVGNSVAVTTIKNSATVSQALNAGDEFKLVISNSVAPRGFAFTIEMVRS